MLVACIKRQNCKWTRRNSLVELQISRGLIGFSRLDNGLLRPPSNQQQVWTCLQSKAQRAKICFILSHQGQKQKRKKKKKTEHPKTTKHSGVTQNQPKYFLSLCRTADFSPMHNPHTVIQSAFQFPVLFFFLSSGISVHIRNSCTNTPKKNLIKDLFHLEF